jgi:aldose 1-epimerase
LPADDLLTIGDGPIQVELLPSVGARVHRLRVFGHDLLRTPDDPSEHRRDPFRWGAYVMAPWCNRIEATPTTVDGEVVRVASNFDDGSAIHGQVYDAPWELAPDGSLSINGGGGGWPWPYRCMLRVAVDGAAVTLDLSLTNLAMAPMPAGLGLHPWFRRPLDVRINAELLLRSNLDRDALLEPVSGPWDLRTASPMPGDLDAAWQATDDPVCELQWPSLGIRAVLRARSDAGVWIVAASPSALDGVAIEPQTHAPWGLRRFINREPGALQLVEPGATLALSTELAFGRL